MRRSGAGLGEMEAIAMKTILVHLYGEGADGPALDAGVALARRLGAHLEGLHLRRPAGSALWRASPYDIAAAGMGGDLLASIEADETARAERARQLFQTRCAEAGLAMADTPPDRSSPTASFVEDAGGLDRVLHRARFNDLLVERAPAPEPGPSSEDIGRLIAGCGRPVLIAPAAPAADLSGTAAVAWKDSLEAARALSAALPLLAAAGRVVLFSASEHARGKNENGLGAKDALAYLAWHGLKAEVRQVEAHGRSPAAAVTDAAIGEGAGLMVMGGYSHRRALEVVLGGFTQDVLDDCRIRTLVVH